MKYAFIEQYVGYYPIALMCRVLNVSASGYYAYRKRPVSNNSKHDQSAVANAVTQIHTEEHGIPGSRKITKALQESESLPKACRNTVAKIMSEVGICGSGTKKFKIVTTESDPTHRVEPNILDQDFEATEPNQKWVTDITYVMLANGTWCYLAAVLDLFSRCIVGWHVADNMETDLVKKALSNAINKRRPESNLLHHSDRGSQYTSDAYRQMLSDAAMISSMSRKGCCYDNAVMERFFKSLKVEWLYDRKRKDMQEAKHQIGFYIDNYYNTTRRHASLSYVSPDAYEAARAAQQGAA